MVPQFPLSLQAAKMKAVSVSNQLLELGVPGNGAESLLWTLKELADRFHHPNESPDQRKVLGTGVAHLVPQCSVLAL